MSADHLDDVDPEDIDNEEASSLLRHSSHGNRHSVPLDTIPKLQRPSTQRRQSSLALRTPDGLPRTPRTANRVRFEVEERESSEHAPNGRIAEDTAWLDDEDYLSHDASITGRGRLSQHAPLLTGIEAPSVTVASTDLDFNAEDLLESARPKSNMGSAFMNMANSIMYVHLCSDGWTIVVLVGLPTDVLQRCWHHRYDKKGVFPYVLPR